VAPIVPLSTALAQSDCVPAAAWTVPAEGSIAAPEILARAARAQMVLLGETHDDADHHRWQLHTVAALAALRIKTVIGFEMFPRIAQGTLDRWVAGELSEEEFLRESDWDHVWGFEATLYMPLFHFARLNHIRMIGLNVERESVRTTEIVPHAAPATQPYIDWLYAIYAEHRKERTPSREDVEFRRFVDSQLVWDRAMAQALADEAQRDPDVLVIGVMGSGHIMNGYGVPRQLADLGISGLVTLLPWDPEADCKELTVGFSTAVFGIKASKSPPGAFPGQR
jgi:uncharacterized iron-regulated protein